MMYLHLYPIIIFACIVSLVLFRRSYGRKQAAHALAFLGLCTLGTFMWLESKESSGMAFKTILNGDSIGLKSFMQRATNVNIREGDSSVITLPKHLGEPRDKFPPDRGGNTLLMVAARHDNADAVDYLLSRGANVNLENNNGETALELAKKYGSKRAYARLKIEE